jgi:DNA-directed RNA polymerase subunit beta
MRPGEPTLDTARTLISSLFRALRLSAVGRGVNCASPERAGLVHSARGSAGGGARAARLRDGKARSTTSTIANRRMRPGRRADETSRIGLRMERAIKERMSSVEIDNVMPHDLIRAQAGGLRRCARLRLSQLSWTRPSALRDALASSLGARTTV